MSDLTTAGLSEIAAAVASRYETSYIGIGTGTTAFNASQTDLLGATKQRIQCDVVVATGPTVTFTATADFDDANFEWAEMGVFLLSSGEPMLTRKVLAAVGTKPASQQWEAEALVTFTLA